MKLQPCPVCEWDDSVNGDGICDACGARFETDGNRIADPDRKKETEFRLREAKPGAHATVEGGRCKGEYVKLVEDPPYVQHAWACLRTGRIYHFSFLMDDVWETEVTQ